MTDMLHISHPVLHVRNFSHRCDKGGGEGGLYGHLHTQSDYSTLYLLPATTAQEDRDFKISRFQDFMNPLLSDCASILPQGAGIDGFRHMHDCTNRVLEGPDLCGNQDT